jgi:hypothetical protein
MVPGTDNVLPSSEHVIEQLEPLASTEQLTPFSDSVPQTHMASPLKIAEQHPLELVEPEQEVGAARMTPARPRRSLRRRNLGETRKSVAKCCTRAAPPGLGTRRRAAQGPQPTAKVPAPPMGSSWIGPRRARVGERAHALAAEATR